MDYYDVVATEQNKEDPEHERDPSGIDKAADKLETEIEKVYEKAYERISSTNWSSLWGSVKKQAADVVTTAKSTATTSLRIPEEDEEAGHEQQPKTPAITAGSDMLNALSSKAKKYIDELDKELDEVETAAASYLSKVGKDVKGILKDAVSVAPPSSSHDGLEEGEDAGPEILFNVPDDIRQQIYSTRLDAQLNALHTSKEPFLTATVEEDYVNFKETDFDLKKMTDTIAADLEQFPSLRKLMESLVPEEVTYEDFWTKYYYMRKQITEQEARRKKLVEQATLSNEKLTWDDDDEEEEGGGEEQEKKGRVEEAKGTEDVKEVKVEQKKDQDTEQRKIEAKESLVDNESVDTLKPTQQDAAKYSRPSSSEGSYDVISKSTADEDNQEEEEEEDDDWE